MKYKSKNTLSVRTNRRSLRSVLIPTIVILFLLGGLVSILLFFNAPQDIRNRAANNGPHFSIEPSTKTAKVGDTFSLGLTLNTGNDTVGGVELHLTYDATTVEIVGFSNGAQFPTVITPEKHGDGLLSVGLMAPLPDGYKGTDIIGTIQVKQIGNKSSAINFSDLTQVFSINKSNNNDINSSLTEFTGTQITVSGSTKTPTPTPVTISLKKVFTTTPTPRTRVTLPSPTPTTKPSSETSNSFGTLTTSNTSVTNPNYTVTNQNEPRLPSETGPYTPYPPTGATPGEKSTNILENIFIAIGSFFQSLVTGLSGNR